MAGYVFKIDAAGIASAAFQQLVDGCACTHADGRRGTIEADGSGRPSVRWAGLLGTGATLSPELMRDMRVEVPAAKMEDYLALAKVSPARSTTRRPATAAPSTSPPAPPGTVLDDEAAIACGTGAIRLIEVQRAGKRTQSAAEFQRGFKLAAGTLIPHPAKD